jgi:hypothetical protein
MTFLKVKAQNNNGMEANAKFLGFKSRKIGCTCSKYSIEKKVQSF